MNFAPEFSDFNECAGFNSSIFLNKNLFTPSKEGEELPIDKLSPNQYKMIQDLLDSAEKQTLKEPSTRESTITVSPFDPSDREAGQRAQNENAEGGASFKKQCTSNLI